MIRALVIDTDGTDMVTDRSWTLPELQDLVEGYIEGVYPPGLAWTGFVDEDGVGLEPPVNQTATRLARAGGWEGPPGWPLRGRAVFFGPADDDGELTDVGDELLATAEQVAP